jgi:bifunctional non-homologous end joining protein LigD
MGLESYHKKRNFRRTPEPKGEVVKSRRRRFVVQEHHASQLHFDFRLEIEGVLKSWSVPKGPTLDPGEKRLAVATEDHPVAYLNFEGRIKEGNYGAGDVRIWDAGDYEPIGGDPGKALKDGKLSFVLRGDKLNGEFNLIRMGRRDRQWLLIKASDEFADPQWKLKTLLPTIVIDDQAVSRKRAEKAGQRKRKPSNSTAKKKADTKAIPAEQAFSARKLSGDIKVKAGSQIIRLTNLNKVYWPEEGYTKGDLIRYYNDVAPHLLPYLKDRPLILKRYPDGLAGGHFYQHDMDQAPAFLRTATLDVEEGHQVDYLVGGTLPMLLYTANLGAIEQHPWNSRTRHPDRPDWIVFDLDPGEDVPYGQICDVALMTRETLKRLGLDCYAKTSGTRGMHLYVPIKPIYDFEQVAGFAARVAEEIAAEQPVTTTTERSLKKRKRDQIYLDHLQNARGKSIVAPYSVRPQKGATVSAPLDWREVSRGEITPGDFTIKTMAKRVARRGDLFAPVLEQRQSLPKSGGRR